MLDTRTRVSSQRRCVLVDENLFALAVVPIWRGHQRGVDDLAAACDDAFLEQLRDDTIEQCFGTGSADTVFEGPDDGVHHRFRRIGKPPSLRADWTRSDAINLGSKCGEVDVLAHLGQRIAQLVDQLARVVGDKQVVLDGVSPFHCGSKWMVQHSEILPVTGSQSFFEAPKKIYYRIDYTG